MVGIGASAGGLTPIREILHELPDAPQMSFIIVQHLAKTEDGLLSELLDGMSPIPVLTAEDGMGVESEHVYVAPPQSIVTIAEGRLHVRQVTNREERRRVIDSMFQSLASAYEDWAVGIILSGNDADGTHGLKEIAHHGGLTLAQDLDDAEFDIMPRSAVESGVVDLQLKPAEMSSRLQAYYDDLIQIQQAEQSTIERQITDCISDIAHRVRLETGHDFAHYKTSTLVRRIQRRMRVLHIIEIDEYVDRLLDEPAEAQELFREVLISVTDFFRDSTAFEVLSEEVIANIVDERDETGTIRVWVPGCATGEEVYSIAILLCERLQEAGSDAWPKIQIFGTDIDEDALHIARRGIYGLAIESHVSTERLQRYFADEKDGYYRVKKKLREMCLFAEHNIIRDPPFVDLDLVSCRNLLIYLNPYLQKQVLLLFHHSLRPSGYLFLGSSETVSPYVSLFSARDRKCRIWQNTADTGAPRPKLPIEGAHRTPSARESSHDQTTERPELHEQFQQVMTEKYAPRAAVVRRDGQLVYASNQLEKYLQIPRGKFEDNLLKMVASGLRLGVRAALQKSASTGERTVHEDLTFQSSEGTQPARVVVQPMPDTGNGNGLYLVVFEETGPSLKEASQALNSSGEAGDLIAHLEHELESTREHLELTIQDLETSNEELKSSNEELRSMNEELRAANEELESSKTEVMESHEKLASAKSDLENLLYSAQLATLFLSDDRTIKMFTSRVIDIYRLRPKDEGRPLDDITHRAVEMPSLPSPAEIRSSREPITHEVQTIDGKWFYRRVLPYINQEGDKDGMIITFTEITDLKFVTEKLRKRTAALEEARKRAEAGNQAKSDFLAKMSHEIRTPMTAILGFAEILRGRLSSPDDINAVDTIIRNANFLLNIINDILDLSKIEDGDLELHIGSCNLRELIDELISSMGVRADQKGLSLDTNIDSAVPEQVEVDFTRLRQILVNLIENAIRFTESGGVKLHVGLLDSLTTKLRLEVIDTGIGIEESSQRDIFEPFVQADSSMTNVAPGTGLGLTIVQRLVDELGGSIFVESEPGKGSTFRVEIPVGLAGENSLQDSTNTLTDESNGGDSAGKEEKTLAHKRVLVVDDNADIRQLLTLFLKGAGAGVESAADGLEAIEIIEEATDSGQRFDAVIMDMQMPNMDGYEATRRLREAGFEKPIIALTASAMCGDAQQCLDVGCTDYLSKPISPEVLLSCIKEHNQPTSDKENLNKSEE